MSDSLWILSGLSLMRSMFLKILPRAPWVTPFFSNCSSVTSSSSSQVSSRRTLVYLCRRSDLSQSLISEKEKKTYRQLQSSRSLPRTILRHCLLSGAVTINTNPRQPDWLLQSKAKIDLLYEWGSVSTAGPGLWSAALSTKTRHFSSGMCAAI